MKNDVVSLFGMASIVNDDVMLTMPMILMVMLNLVQQDYNQLLLQLNSLHHYYYYL